MPITIAEKSLIIGRFIDFVIDNDLSNSLDEAKSMFFDGPEGEDGPWAEGWEERSGD